MDQLCGVDSLAVVYRRFSDGVEVVRCMLEFCKDLAEIERSYASSIHKLIRSSAYTFHQNILMQWLGGDPYEEIGTVKRSWQRLGTELCKLADLHNEKAAAYQDVVRQPLADLLPQLEERRKTLKTKVQVVRIPLETSRRKHAREKQRYFQLGESYNQLEQKAAELRDTMTPVVPSSRLDKLEKRLLTLSGEMGKQEAVYQQSHVDLMQTYESFNQELIDLFKSTQEMEMERVSTVKKALQEIAKTLSNTVPAYLEGMQQIVLSVNEIDGPSDVEWFVQSHKDLLTTPLPPPLEKYTPRTQSFTSSENGSIPEGDDGRNAVPADSGNTSSDQEEENGEDDESSREEPSSEKGQIGEHQTSSKLSTQERTGAGSQNFTDPLSEAGVSAGNEQSSGQPRESPLAASSPGGQSQPPVDGRGRDKEGRGEGVGGRRGRSFDDAPGLPTRSHVASVIQRMETKQDRQPGVNVKPKMAPKPKLPPPSSRNLPASQAKRTRDRNDDIIVGQILALPALQDLENNMDRSTTAEGGSRDVGMVTNMATRFSRSEDSVTDFPVVHRVHPTQSSKASLPRHLPKPDPTRLGSRRFLSDAQARDNHSHVPRGSRVSSTVPILPQVPVEGGADDPQLTQLLHDLQQHSAAHDYYDVLGVAAEAPAEGVAKARREKSRELHPDHYVNDPEGRARAEEQLVLINQVFQDVLKSQETRSLYDQLCHFRKAYPRILSQKSKPLQSAERKLVELHRKMKKAQMPLGLLNEIQQALKLIRGSLSMQERDGGES